MDGIILVLRTNNLLHAFSCLIVWWTTIFMNHAAVMNRPDDKLMELYKVQASVSFYSSTHLLYHLHIFYLCYLSYHDSWNMRRDWTLRVCNPPWAAILFALRETYAHIESLEETGSVCCQVLLPCHWLLYKHESSFFSTRRYGWFGST